MISRSGITVALGLALAFTFENSASADGMVYRLPPDGTWVRYRVEQSATEVMTLDGKPLPDMTVESTLTLRSVGQVARQGGNARWIELEWSIPPVADRPGRIIVLKMLIPEGDFRRGRDPLADVHELYFWDRDWEWQQQPEASVKERLTDKARVQYEIERFRTLFPFPTAEPEPKLKSTRTKVSVPHGEFAVERISYPVKFEGKLSGGKAGRWEWEGTYSLDVSDAAGFGVVALEASRSVEEEYTGGEGIRMKDRVEMELESSGADAQSALRECPE